jgi:hypothetical protein
MHATNGNNRDDDVWYLFSSNKGALLVDLSNKIIADQLDGVLLQGQNMCSWLL